MKQRLYIRRRIRNLSKVNLEIVQETIESPIESPILTAPDMDSKIKHPKDHETDGSLKGLPLIISGQV
jgi:hypothetical protein